MSIRDFIRKMMSRKERYSEIADEQRIHERIDEKKLSSNERELNKILEKKREEQIKVALENYRRREQYEVNHANTWRQKPLFKEKGTILKQKAIFVNSPKRTMLHWR